MRVTDFAGFGQPERAFRRKGAERDLSLPLSKCLIFCCGDQKAYLFTSSE